jgi:predicted nucleotidyltransferase
MRLDRALDNVLETRGHVQVLRAIVELPDGASASARDLARRAGVAHTTAARVLRSLADSRIVHAQRAGRADLYRLNQRHALAPAIKAMFAAELMVRAELLDHLTEQISRSAGPVKAAYLFGSASRGETDPESDIDLALVEPSRTGERLMSALSSLSDGVRERFGSELNVIVDDGTQRRRAPIWARIEREGLRLLPKRARRA